MAARAERLVRRWLWLVGVAALYVAAFKVHLYAHRGPLSQASLDSSPVLSKHRRQYGYVLAHSNHKTGTFQLSCVADAIASVTHTRKVWQPEKATLDDVSVPLMLRGPTRFPVMVAGGHPPLQMCYGRRRGRPSTFRCPIDKVPCNSCGMPILSLEGCLLALPTTPHGKPGAVHLYRNPWDVITSAYWFHVQDPVPETEAWLHSPMSTVIDWITASGVPLSELEALGAVDAGDTPYVEVLRGMPEEQAVQLQFWQMAPELYSMARHYKVLHRLPGSFQLRFEDAQRNLNSALLPVLREFFPEKEDDILAAVDEMKCDPSRWSPDELASSDHVTGAKRAPGHKEELQRALWAQPAIRWHLCELSAALGYEPPFPCSSQARVEGLKRLYRQGCGSQAGNHPARKRGNMKSTELSAGFAPAAAVAPESGNSEVADSA